MPQQPPMLGQGGPMGGRFALAVLASRGMQAHMGAHSIALAWTGPAS
jgi:hypothetical protein